MLDRVTPEQIETYRTQGFVVIEDFLSPQELAQWRDTADQAVQRRLRAISDGMASGTVKKTLGDRFRAPAKAMLGQKTVETARSVLRKILGSKRIPIGFNGTLNSNQGNPESYYAKVYTQVIHLAKEDPRLGELIFNERLGKIASALSGASGMRLYHDQALFKQAYGNPTAWHLDNPYWAFHSDRAMTMWVALDDATLTNGCICYIPGSHKQASHTKNLSIGDNFAGLLKMYPDWMKIDPVSCPCRAGSVVFHNGMTAHGAGVNITNKPRRAYAVAFMPDGSTFNGIKDVLPDEYFKSLKVGDLLNNEKVHPLLWRDSGNQTPNKTATATPEPVAV
ncbi:MAG: phytanoyl-CoA dioxygenase family protein [Burkholderiales bacterium]|nr:phytanoyl-CoA dioxygenase family protein [Phycisphaerae bacterium]